MDNNIGNKIRYLREERGITQKQLAENISSTNKNIWAYETGYTLPPVDTIIRLSKFFGVSVDYLLGLEDDFGKTVIGSVPVGSSDSARSAVSTVDDLLSPEERKLIADYRKLDKVSKRAIERTASSLAEDPGDKVKQLFGENKR